MRVAITGAAGSVGSYLAPFLADRGHELVLVDRDANVVDLARSVGAAAYVGSIGDRTLMQEALDGSEAIVHSAWSFSDEPEATFSADVLGYVSCLEAAVRSRVRQILFFSSAVVYGYPRSVPIEEDHPCLVEQARKPLYAAAKLAAEHLGYVYSQRHGLAVTNVRFWWAYGADIGGRHLKDMVKRALAGNTLEVPAGAGGSFLHLSDLGYFVEIWLRNAPPAGSPAFNLATCYVGWEEIASLIVDLTGCKGGYVAVNPANWRGSSFLMGVWKLSWAKAQAKLGFAPRLSPSEALGELRGALARLVDRIRENPEPA